MKYYKLRIDIIPQLSLEVYNLMEVKYFSRFVRSLEGLENRHFHYYVETDNAVALRQYIRKHIGTGNGVYSLKELDEECPIEYMSYIIKEDPNPKWFNFSEEKIKEIVLHSQQVNEEIKLKKKSKSTSIDKVEECYLYIKDKDGSPFDLIIEWYLSKGNMIRESQIVVMYDTIECKYLSEDRTQRGQFKYKLSQRIKSRLDRV